MAVCSIIIYDVKVKMKSISLRLQKVYDWREIENV